MDFIQENSELTALAGLGAAGSVWHYMERLKVPTAASHFTYLDRGLAGWRAAAGLSATDQVLNASPRHLILEHLKRFEETLMGIPRTFSLFDMAASSALGGKDTNYRMTGEQVAGMGEYISDLFKQHGQKLQPEDLIRGLDAIGQEDGTVNLVRKDGSTALENIKLRVRRWAIEGEGLHDAEGRLRNQHVMRGTSAGASLITPGGLSAYSSAPDIIPMKAPKVLGGRFGDSVDEAVFSARIFAKDMTVRYMKILDRPLELFEEMMSTNADDLVEDGRRKWYQVLNNRLGSGGDYTGTTTDIWKRHIKRTAGLYVGASLAYEGAAMLSEQIFGKSPIQLGADVVAAGQRLYAGASDAIGLTALNKYQQEEAEGSHRLLGLAALPLSGFITGSLVGYGKSVYDAYGASETAWEASKRAIHKVDPQLNFLRAIPGMKDFGKEPVTLGRKMGVRGVAIGALLALPFLPGALGSSKSYDEVVAEQSGEVEVVHRKGEGWETGKVDIEGGRAQYYAPGWYAKVQADAEAEDLFGEYNNRPFSRLIKGLFDPYWIEEEHYHDRPYLAATADTGWGGPLGSLWGATIGAIIKPTVYMHTEDLEAGTPTGVAGDADQFGVPLGTDADMGGAMVEGDLDYTQTETMRRLQAATGLAGYALKSVYEGLTDTKYFDQSGKVIEGSGDMGSAASRFWGLGLGGGYTSTEAIRRFLPEQYWDQQSFNPIRNEMPDWLPDDYYIDFKHGDPYADSGSNMFYRLPGEGYASRFEELEGVAPEDYSAVHRFNIIADVAPYSREYKNLFKEVSALRDSGQLTEEESTIVNSALAKREEVEELRHFRKEPSGILGTLWAGITDVARANPVEHLLPFSPVHKFSGPGSAVDQYRQFQQIGNEQPAWTNPGEDFVEPALNSLLSLVGMEYTPDHVEEFRGDRKYYDQLEYIKQTRLATQAETAGDSKAAFSHRRKAKFTMAGMDPYADANLISRVLPKADRDYFKAFVAERDIETREEIMEAAPDYMQHFLRAQWRKQAYVDMIGQEDLGADQMELAGLIEADRAREGREGTVDDWTDYLDEVEEGRAANSFGEYLRQRAILEDMSEGDYELPPEDWVGWQKYVDIDHVKVKALREEGKDHHDHNLWEDDVREAEERDFVAQAVSEMGQGSKDFEIETLRRILNDSGMQNISISIIDNDVGEDRFSVDVDVDRRQQAREMLRARGTL